MQFTAFLLEIFVGAHFLFFRNAPHILKVRRVKLCLRTENAFFGLDFLPKNDKRRETIMSSKNSNQINIPQAREAMDKFKMQAAQEVGVNLTNGYNGHLTSREAGSVGGQMVKNICPIRNVKFVRQNRIAQGHIQAVEYMIALAT